VKYLYEEMSWPQADAAAAAGAVAVIPYGTTEQHGPHMPLMTDYLIAGSVARAAVERVVAAQPDRSTAPRAVVLHPVTYSFNEHHMDLPGTVAIGAHTIIDYLVEVGRSLAHHGFARMVILNGHGSNAPFMDIAARLITNQTPSICAGLAWWSLLTAEDRAGMEVPSGLDSHAGETETSLVLHLRPELVDMSKAVRTIDEVQRSQSIMAAERSSVNFQEWWSRNSTTGVQGDATKATAEKGRALFEAAASRVAAFVEEFAAREIRPRTDMHTAPQADGRRRWWLGDGNAFSR
jgi:creatinine amidohydrolase